MMHLLPCAHCGGDAETDFIEGESYIIECHDCDARTGIQDSPEEAVEAWNRRAGSSFATGVLYGIRMSLMQITPMNFDIDKIPLFPRREHFYNTGIRNAFHSLQILERSAKNGHVDIGGNADGIRAE